MVKSTVLNNGLVFIALMVLASGEFWVLGSAMKEKFSEEAYVTLLYGDEFLLGVRVLGKSIHDSGSTKDMVVLVSDGVSDYAKRLLAADGWIVEMISLLENPNQVRPTRFWGVYTKLKIFNMTNYKKVVYLDADTIVIKNIDDLFNCGKFCANLKHSERLNSGVLVVKPSEELFKDMLSKVKTMYSYTGGDQGFLNSYYVGFANAQIFDPDVSSEALELRLEPEMQRLSTLYNADVGLYMLANKWMVDEKELRVIHYTLGPLKPWDWWTGWLVKPVDLWQDIRQRLPESLPGTRGGSNPRDGFLVKLLSVLPFVALLFCYYRSFIQIFGSLPRNSLIERVRHLVYKLRSGSPHAYSAVSSSTINSNHQHYYGLLSKVPTGLGGMSIVICFFAAVLSLGLALLIVPRQVGPWAGVLLMYEWTFIIFFLVLGGYLRLVHQLGKRKAAQLGVSSDPESLNYDSGKGHQKLVYSLDDGATWYYAFGMVFLAIAVPSLPSLLGVTALFLRLGLMAGGSTVLAAFMAYASEHLAIRSFIRGLEDRDTQRTRSVCLP